MLLRAAYGLLNESSGERGKTIYILGLSFLQKWHKVFAIVKSNFYNDFLEIQNSRNYYFFQAHGSKKSYIFTPVTWSDLTTNISAFPRQVIYIVVIINSIIVQNNNWWPSIYWFLPSISRFCQDGPPLVTWHHGRNTFSSRDGRNISGIHSQDYYILYQNYYYIWMHILSESFVINFGKCANHSCPVWRGNPIEIFHQSSGVLVLYLKKNHKYKDFEDKIFGHLCLVYQFIYAN